MEIRLEQEEAEQLVVALTCYRKKLRDAGETKQEQGIFALEKKIIPQVYPI